MNVAIRSSIASLEFVNRLGHSHLHNNVEMTHPVWPLFDLRVRTPRLELRYIDDELATELALLAAEGYPRPSHHAVRTSRGPMSSRRELERNTMQFYWRCRAETSPKSWSINLATIVDGKRRWDDGADGPRLPDAAPVRNRVVARPRVPGPGHRQRDASRIAATRLHRLRCGIATTGAWHDNGPSLGVTRSLGYAENGHKRMMRRDSRRRAVAVRDEPSRLRRASAARRHHVARCRRVLAAARSGRLQAAQ